MKNPEIRLSDLKGNPNNPRFIKEENAEFLKKSISSLGDLSCIVYNERFDRLVGGHQRKSVILKLLGENPVITRTKTYETPNEVQTTGEGYIEIGTEHYKVRFVDFSEADEALAIIIANDQRNQGQYDLQLLPTMVDLADSSIKSLDFQLMNFVEGFNIEGFGGDFLDEGKKSVEFEAGDGKEKILSFKLSKSDYIRAMARIDEIKNEMSLDTNEEAILYILFT